MNSSRPAPATQIHYIRISKALALRATLIVEKSGPEWFDAAQLQKVILAIRNLLPSLIESNSSSKDNMELFQGDSFEMKHYLSPVDIRHSVMVKDPQTNTYTGLTIYKCELVAHLSPLSLAEAS